MATKRIPPTAPAGYDFDREAAASYLGLRPATLSWYSYRGLGPPFTYMARKAWYKRRDLDAFIQSRAQEPVGKFVKQR